MKKLKEPFKICTKKAIKQPQKARKILIGLGIAFIVLSVSQAVYAQESSNCEDLRTEASSSPQPQMIDYDGLLGMFIPMAGARYILCQVQELTFRLQEITILNRELNSYRLQMELLEQQIVLAQQVRDQVESVLEVSETRAREAEERVNVWYRRPTLWFAVGAVVTVGLFIGAAYSVGALDFTN